MSNSRYESIEGISVVEKKPGASDYSLEEILSVPPELNTDEDIIQIRDAAHNLSEGAGTRHYILALEQKMRKLRENFQLPINPMATLRTNRVFLEIQKEKIVKLIEKTNDKLKLKKLDEFKFFYEDALRRINILDRFDKGILTTENSAAEPLYQVIYEAPASQLSNISVASPATTLHNTFPYTSYGRQPSAQSLSIKEAAIKIEAALYAGETTICHSNARERKAFAMTLAKKHYQNCTYSNVELFTAIYKYSFDHSGFFSNSTMLGTFIFWSSTLQRGYPRIDPTSAAAKKHMAENPQSRTALICEALGYKLVKPKNQIDVAFRGKQF